jgi:hypothetical protein
MPHVVSKIQDNDRTFELYDDGDCVMTIPSFGYVSLNRDILALLTGKKSSPAPEIHKNGTKQIIVPEASFDDSNISDQKIKRKIAQLENKTWDCVMLVAGKQDIHHIYSSRSLARAGVPQNKVGQNGRVA